MSDYKKCDRCGEYYAKDIDNRKLSKLYDNGNKTYEEWDLCSNCWKLFESWIADGKNSLKAWMND